MKTSKASSGVAESPLILSCFFLSGVAGLIYEVLWVRLIDKVMGSAPFAVATVLSVFMGGLALGSYLAGSRVDRMTGRKRLLSVYGKLEVGIGAYALLLPLLMVMVKPVYAMAYNWLFAWFWAYNLVAFFGCALLLLPPTLLMGATLPILCRFYVDHLGHVGTRTGRLYGLNTVGAALGAFLTGFLLIRTLGVWNTLFAGAGINFLVGLTCMLAGRVSPASDSKKEGLRRARVANGRPGAPPIGADSPPGARWALWIFAVSGFCAMAYEVIWTRLLGLVIGPTVYSFTLVVGTFIVGLALGSVIFGLVGDRVQGALPILAGTQTGAALLALLVSQFFGNSQFFFAKLIYTLRDAFGEMMLLQGFMVFLLLLGPTLLLGAAFPLVNRIYARSMARMGRSIGTAYALNTIGAILGSFAAGFILMPFLGKETSLKFVCGLQFATALAAWGWVASRGGVKIWRWLALSGMCVLGVLLFSSFPDWNRQLLSYGRYHNFKDMEGDFARTSWTGALTKGQKILLRHETGREIVFYGDGLGGFTTVEKLTDSMGTVKYTLLNSGKPDASSHGDRSTQTLLAHVPLLFHPKPERVMVLGLASGMTAGEALYYPIDRLDVLEVNKEVIKACEFFTPWNNGVLRDPRAHILFQDGRNHLELTRRTYDVIISEPSNPWMAGLANLYTLEFFRTVRDRLRDKGIFVQWIHSYEMDWPTFAMVGRTFSEVFPRGVLMTTLTGVGDYLLVGFKGEQGLDLKVALEQFKYARKSRNMTLPDPRLLFHLVMAEDLKGLFGTGPLHTDSWPRLEFAAPRLLYGKDSGIAEKIMRNRSLSLRTKEIIEASSTTDDLIHMVAFSASVFSPLFGIVDPEQASPAQRERYFDILDGYCRQSPVGDYGVLPDKACRERCAHLQEEAIRKHLADKPEDGPAYYSLGLALKEVGETEEAIKAFQKAISLDRFLARAYNNLGIAFLEKGEIPEARKAFLSALSVDPAHAKAYFNLAQISLAKGDRNGAIDYLNKGLRYEDNPVAKRLIRELLLSDERG
jgi:spermidine synthase